MSILINRISLLILYERSIGNNKFLLSRNTPFFIFRYRKHCLNNLATPLLEQQQQKATTTHTVKQNDDYDERETTTNENYHDYHKYSHINFFMCCIYIFVLYCWASKFRFDFDSVLVHTDRRESHTTTEDGWGDGAREDDDNNDKIWNIIQCNFKILFFL